MKSEPESQLDSRTACRTYSDMATLRDAIKAHIAGLENRIKAIRRDSAEAIAPIEEELDIERKKLNQFGPWLDKELGEVLTVVTDLIRRYEDPQR